MKFLALIAYNLYVILYPIFLKYDLKTELNYVHQILEHRDSSIF